MAAVSIATEANVAVIAGTHDSFFTVKEFAALIGRTEKTVRNWIADGRLVPHRLFGVPMVSLRFIENALECNQTPDAANGDLARNLMQKSRR